MKNKMKLKNLAMAIAVSAIFVSCGEKTSPNAEHYANLANQYAKVTLTSNIDHLSSNEKEMLRYLFDAGQIMDDIFWTENLGSSKAEFLDGISDANARKYAEIN